MDKISAYKEVLIKKIEDNYDIPQGLTQLSSFLFICEPSLRLTYEGFKFMKKHFQHYVFEYVEKDARCNQLYHMDKLFTAPYYKSSKNIYLFSKKDTVIVRLHGDDVLYYLDKEVGWDERQNNS